MTPIERIENFDSDYTKIEIEIKNYILNNLDIVVKESIIGLSKNAGVSKTSILRFCQKIGYKGFSEFKYDISRFLTSGLGMRTDNINNNKEIVEIYTNSIKQIPDFLNDNILDELKHLFIKAKHIKIYGNLETGLAAGYFSYRLAAIGINSEVINQSTLFNSKVSLSREDDLNVFISLSGTADYIENSIDISNENKAKTVVMTQNSRLPFNDKVTATLVMPTLNINKNSIFLDSQVIVFTYINMIVSYFSRNM